MSGRRDEAVRVRKPPELARLGRGHAIVEASAGTGKTYVLEHLVIDLLLQHECELGEILVVTFTEKATAELVHRVRRKIHELASLSPDSATAKDGARAPDDEVWIIGSRARDRLRRALLSFDAATISTIHAFCQRLLTDYAFLQRRLFDEETVDEKDAFAAAFAEALRRDVASNPITQSHLEVWLRSGRTIEVLEQRLFDCHRELACLHPRRPEAVRPPPFDEASLGLALAAWNAVDAEALRGTLKAAKVHHSSVKAIGERIAQVTAILAQHRPDVPMLLAAVNELATPKTKEKLFDYLRDRLAPVSAQPAIAAFLRAANALDQAAPPPLAALVHHLLPAVTARLDARKRQAGLFDYQDMLTLTARSLDGDGPGAQALLRELRGRYRFALIDEFQDTDEVQWHIFRRIFFESAGAQVLTVIGDPKQAIYSFRGADVHTYARAREEIVSAGGPCVHLTSNFRSSKPLIDALNLFLDQNAGNDSFFRPAGRILYDHPVTCGRTDLALTDQDGRAQAPVVLLEVKPALQASAADLRTWQIKQAVKTAMVQEIRGLIADGTGLCVKDTSGSRRLFASDIFILTRTTRESREAGDALQAAGLPFAYFKQEYLFATVEAREILDLLCAIADPDDRTLRARAFITGFFGLALPDLAACEDLAASDPLLRQLYEWKALADAGLWGTLFARIVDDSGIVCREAFLHASERALTNYQHIFETLQAEAALGRGTIRDLAQTLGAYVARTRKPPGRNSDVQRLETDARAVQIMTIHHAKGLEAPVVFLYGGFWPGPNNEVRALHDEEGRRIVRVGRQPSDEAERYEVERDDEERRVLYVGLTRARVRMYLPLYPAAFKYLRGSYAAVNQRLLGALGGFSDPETCALFERREVQCVADSGSSSSLPQWPLASWRPSPALLVEIPVNRAFETAAHERAGFTLTSYSAVKRRRGGFVPAEAAAEDPAANEQGEPPDAAGFVLSNDELPRGRLSGSYLHEVLELVSFAELRGSPPLDVWRASAGVAALFEKLRRRHDRNPAHVPHAQRLVHAALTTPVRLGDTTMPGLAGAARSARELEFLYPIPERGQPLLGDVAAGADADARPWTIARGLVKGFIDFLFEHDGRLYVCDWKGDWLPSWQPDRVAAHSEANYAIQARLYTLAALRLGGIDDEASFTGRFGGVLYCFLRGMREEKAGNAPARADAASPGVYFHRPSWREVGQWQDDMLGRAFWGLS